MAKAVLEPYAKWLKKSAKHPSWPKRITIVGIYWLDAAMIEDGDTDDHGPIRVFTVGTVVKATNEYIAVAHEIFVDGTTRVVTTVPCGMVLGVVQFGTTDFLNEP